MPSALEGVQRTDPVEAAFLDMAVNIDGISEALDYRPEIYPPNCICMYFDSPDLEPGATSNIAMKRWEWIIEIAIMGDDRRDMQRRMKIAILGVVEGVHKKQTWRPDPTQPRVLDGVEIRNLGPVVPIRSDNAAMTYLHKMMRLTGRAEQIV